VSGVLRFFRGDRGQPDASSDLTVSITAAFVAAIKAFVERENAPLRRAGRPCPTPTAGR